MSSLKTETTFIPTRIPCLYYEIDCTHGQKTTTTSLQMTRIDHLARCPLKSLHDSTIQLNQQVVVFAVFRNFRVENLRSLDQRTGGPGVLVGRVRWHTSALQHATFLAGTFCRQVTNHQPRLTRIEERSYSSGTEKRKITYVGLSGARIASFLLLPQRINVCRPIYPDNFPVYCLR